MWGSLCRFERMVAGDGGRFKRGCAMGNGAMWFNAGWCMGELGEMWGDLEP